MHSKEFSIQSELSVANTVPVSVEVLEELTQDEADDRHRLELKIERAFYEAGCALRELRERRLYRSTHSNFEEYCRNATESFFPKKSGIYSQWLLDDAGVFTFCRYYPAINLLAAVANNPDEQAQRTTALARHADKFVALTEFSKQLVESL